MAEGPNSPATVTQSDLGTNYQDWTNPTYVVSSNDQYATATSSGKTTERIDATNFSFAIPADSLIEGIVVEVEVKASTLAYSPVIYSQIIMGSKVCIDIKGIAIASTSDAYYTLGASNNLWGGWYTAPTTITAADVNDSTFGCYVYCQQQVSPGTQTYSVDHIRMTIYYTAPDPKSVSDTVSVTDTASISDVTHTYVAPVTNNKGYVLNNVTKVIAGSEEPVWTYLSNWPFTGMLYSTFSRQLLGARRDTGQLAELGGDPESGLAWQFDTGYLDFGQFDEAKAMPELSSAALKRFREFQARIKSDGDITLKCYTEEDTTTGVTLTVAPDTTDNAVYNAVRTAMSRDIRGTSIRLVFSGTCDFWMGKMAMRLDARKT